MYKHFVFDIDGTLIDTEKTGVLSLIDTVRDLMGKELPYDQAYCFFGIPSSKVGDILGYKGKEDFGETWEQNFIRLSDMIRPFEGVEEVLVAVKKSGLGTGCVTSRNRFEFNKDTHLAKLLPFLDHSVCAEDTTLHKPNPDPLQKYISLAGEAAGKPVAPSDCLYIGDTMHDYQCAAAAGCDFALADWRHRGMQSIPAKYHLTEVKDIIKLMKYNELLPKIKSLVEGECDPIAKMANISAILHQTLGFWWTGFYRVEDGKLLLGPFQGPLACMRIPFGKGVCGTAWKQEETVIVPDVEQFPGHIACSSESRSEIVVPVWNDKKIAAVLDIDSRDLATFSEVDKTFLEEVVTLIYQ